MRDQFVGDIGDWFKFGLLRALKPKRRLGVAWYLFPDDPKSTHGSKIDYLDNPEKWRDLDPVLFDELKEIVNGVRNIKAIEQSLILKDTTFSGELLHWDHGYKGIKNNVWRKNWFSRTLKDLEECDLVFADPDNTLCEDISFNFGGKSHWGKMPLSEVLTLAGDRAIVVYHHNNREEPHEIQNKKWVDTLGQKTLALRFRDDGARTFFISNYDRIIEQRVWSFYEKWKGVAKISVTE